MAALHIRLLGEFRFVYDDKQIVAIRQMRQQTLLAYLLLHRHTPHLRQQIAFLFWPDNSEAQAHTNLRQLLHHIRRVWPDLDDFVQIDDRVLHWKADVSFTLDVMEFETRLEQAANAVRSQQFNVVHVALQEAVALYGGELLPGNYEEWLLSERERLRQRLLDALEQLALFLESRRDYEQAIHYADQLLRADPLQEITYQHLMRLHALNGDRSGALRTYHVCASLLERELGVQPNLDTQQAYARLLDLQTTQPRAESTTTRMIGSARLVGRLAEWEVLQAAWHNANRGRAQLLLLIGEAGIGKTRLAEELLEWASRQGILAARTRAYAAEGALAYAPVVEWLRSESLRSALDNLQPLWRSEIARLLPELLAENPDLPPPEPLHDRWQRQRFFEALARAVLARAQPLLLVIDDLQWCDLETLEWLHFLVRFDAQARLLIAGTVRPEEVDDSHPLTSLVLHLRSADRLTEVELGPLSVDESAVLARQEAGRPLAVAFLDQLYAATEGNPLFVVETVHANLHDAPARPDDAHNQTSHDNLKSSPPKVLAVIQARLNQLSPPARSLAGLAAAIGRAFTFDVLQQAARDDEDTLVVALDELWRRRIVREQGSAGYDFSHDRIRDAAYAQLSTARRRTLHRRIAVALERVHAADLGLVSGQLAAHYEQAGLAEQAIHFYEQAADHAQQRFARRDAVTFLRRGLALLATLPETVQRQTQQLSLALALGIGLASLYGAIGDEVQQIFIQAELLSQQLGQKLLQYVAQRGLWSNYLSRTSLFEARAQAARNVLLAEELQDPFFLRDAYTNVGLAAFEMGEFTRAVESFEQAIAHPVPPGSTPPTGFVVFEPGIETPFLCATSLALLGYLDRARQRCDEALRLVRTVHDPFTRAAAHYFAIQFYQVIRDIPTVQALATDIEELAIKYEFTAFMFDGPVFHDWATAVQTRSNASIARLRQQILAYQETDNYQLTHYYALLAEACSASGQVVEGLAAASVGLDLAERTHERFWSAELYRLQGDLLMAQGEEGAERCYTAALEVARQQNAKTLELRAAVSLARLWQTQNRYAEARRQLAEIYDWFAEGFDTVDLLEAEALLIGLNRLAA